MKTDSQIFKKSILLLGPSQSGKSRVARLLCNGRNTICIDGRKLKDDLNLLTKNKQISVNTEIVLIDDFNFKKIGLEIFFKIIVKGFEIEGSGILVRPQFIFTTDHPIEDIDMGGSFDGRFDIFELKRCNKNIV